MPSISSNNRSTIIPSIMSNYRSSQDLHQKISAIAAELEKLGGQLEQAFKNDEDRIRFRKLSVVELLRVVREERLVGGSNRVAEHVMSEKFKIFGNSLELLLSRPASMFSTPDDVFLFLQLHGHHSEFCPMSDDDDDDGLLSTPAFGSSGGNETSPTGVEPMQIEFAT